MRLAASGEAFDRGVDALVGGGEGDPHVAGTRPAVEGARRDQDAARGEPGERVEAGLGTRFCSALRPEVERALRVVDAESGALERVLEDRTTPGVPRVLLVDVGVVVQG